MVCLPQSEGYAIYLSVALMYINYFGLILEYKPRNLVFLQNAKASISNFRSYLKTAVADVTEHSARYAIAHYKLS